MDKLIDMIKRELTALGKRWRNDWSGFDGRTLKWQLECLIKAIDEKNVKFSQFTDWVKEHKDEFFY